MSSLESAQLALQAGEWDAARTAFRSVAAETSDPVSYEGLAVAAWWLDDARTCVSSRENAYRRHRDLGDDLGAARAATALAWDTLLFGLGEAVALGWLGRARDLLGPLAESAEHGWLAIREAELGLEVWHDPELALASAQHAAEIACRGDHDDLRVVGQALQGLALTAMGRVDEGMAGLDVAVASATAGDVADPMWMGKVCCWLILACHDTQDVARAEDWCRRVEAICIERDLAPLFNVCRIQYASVLIDRGAWIDAERELTRAMDRLADSRRASRLEAVVRLGELRRRQGRLSEADSLFAQAEFVPVAISGRAQIKWAQGDPAGAWNAMQRLLHSLPLDSRLSRAALLLPAVQIALAAGDADAATLAVTELRATAKLVGKDPLWAMASVAEAAVAQPAEAVTLLSDAVRRYALAGLDYDEAHTRLELVAALLGVGDIAAAQEQLERATTALTNLSASADLAQARRLAKAAGVHDPGPLTSRELEVLRLVSEGMSNQEIAVKIVVSEHTVHRHVANILAKLGQTSRTGAATHAINAGLL
jgi:DNA-binding NarL/FixJ family response regulator